MYLNMATETTAFTENLDFLIYATVTTLVLTIILILTMRKLNDLGWIDELSFLTIDSVVYEDDPQTLSNIKLEMLDNKVVWDVTTFNIDGKVKRRYIPFNRVNLSMGDSCTIKRIIVNHGREVTTLYEIELPPDLLGNMQSQFLELTGEYLTIYNWGLKELEVSSEPTQEHAHN